MILIDADIIVDVFRRYPPAVSWANSLALQEVGVVGFAAMEVVQGCGNADALRRAEQTLSRFQIVWPRTEDCERALRRFGERRLRFGLDVADALIAETAIGRNVQLHTFNTRHFNAYPDLQTVQPYAKT